MQKGIFFINLRYIATEDFECINGNVCAITDIFGIDYSFQNREIVTIALSEPEL